MLATVFLFPFLVLELFLVLLIGLIVLGPNRLPEVVKSVTKSAKWIKKTISSTKEEISKNIGLDEIYQDLRNEEIMEKTKSSSHEEEK